MKSDLIKTVIPEHTKEWLESRNNYIGASDIGTVMGQNKWKGSFTLFHEKIGLIESKFRGNRNTVMGRLTEGTIADIWEFTDPHNPDEWAESFLEGKKIRKCKRILGTLQNKDFMWLSASLDRVINVGQPDAYGNILEEECPLEIKRINSWAMRSYENEIPPAYILQCQQQMLVTETTYSELFMLDSDNNVHLLPIERSKELCDAILARSKVFWDNVLEGRKIVEELRKAEVSGDISIQEKCLAAIDELTPDPMEGEERLYEEYIKEKHDEVNYELIQGGDDMLDICIDLKNHDALMKLLESRVISMKNIVRDYIGDAGTMEFENNSGKVTWKMNKKEVRVFNNMVDYKIDVDLIKEVASKVNF